MQVKSNRASFATHVGLSMRTSVVDDAGQEPVDRSTAVETCCNGVIVDVNCAKCAESSSNATWRFEMNKSKKYQNAAQCHYSRLTVAGGAAAARAVACAFVTSRCHG